MFRALRVAGYAFAAASLAACSSSPMGPTEAKCDARAAECVNADYVNPNIDYVNPNIDYVNPNV